MQLKACMRPEPPLRHQPPAQRCLCTAFPACHLVEVAHNSCYLGHLGPGQRTRFAPEIPRQGSDDSFWQSPIPVSTSASTMPSVIYAKHDGVEISLDYYLPPGDGKCPILLWFHGGGLLMGSRKSVWPHLLNAPEKHGLCMVTADYRLAPQTHMPGIMKDLGACMAYLRSPEFASETGGRVDQSRIIVSGGSAGGWLALLLGSGVGFNSSGLEAPERPLGVCAIYPITDITAPFWTTPQHRAYYLVPC